MKSSLGILSDNEYVELMYFSEDILVVISIIFSMDLHHCISDILGLLSKNKENQENKGLLESL
jgi:hypothetical protein